MKKQILLPSVLAAALAAGSAYAAGTGEQSGMQQTDMGGQQQQQAAGTQEQGYDPARVGVGGVAADRSAQITNNTDAVTQIQQALQQEGHDVAVDGIWGPNTEQALRDFQEQQGIAEPDGRPGEETLQALDIDLAEEIYDQSPQTAATPSEGNQGQRQQQDTGEQDD